MSLFRDAASSALSNVLATAGRLLITIVVIRALPQAEYGRFVFAQWLIALLFMVFSLPGLLTRFLPQLRGPPGSPQARLTFWLLAANLASVVVCTAGFAGYAVFAGQFSAGDLPVLAVWCATTGLSAVLAAALQGRFRFDALLVGNIAIVACSGLLFLFHPKLHSAVAAAAIMGVVWGVSCAASLATVGLWRGEAQAQDAHGRPPVVTEIARYGFNVWVTGLVAGLVWQRGEMGILKLHATDSQIALYGVALTIIGAITQGMQLFYGALMPHFVRYISEDRYEEMSRTLMTISQVTMILAAGGTLCLLAFGREILTLFGPHYAAAYGIVSITAAGSIALTCSAASLILQITSHAAFSRNSNLIAMAVLFGVTAILAPSMASEGAAWGRTLSQVTVALLTFYVLGRQERLRGEAVRLALSLAASLGIVVLFAGALMFVTSLVARLGLTVVFSVAAIAATRMIIGVPFVEIVRQIPLPLARAR